MSSRIDVFNQLLTASLRQPLSLGKPDFKSYRTLVNLRITEQRNESSGEKEVKFEISRQDDFEFLYAEVLNNDKYQTLARDFDLTVDFETFPKVVIQHLLCKKAATRNEEELNSEQAEIQGIANGGRLTEIHIILDSDKSSCAFELFARTPVSKGKLFSIKLPAVRGDQLISHLLKICSSQSTELKKLQKNEVDLNILKCEAENMMKDSGKLQRKLNEVEANLGEVSDRSKELEEELELVKEERENIRVLAEERELVLEELQIENEKLSKDNGDVKEELEIVGRMLVEEQTKVDKLQKKCMEQHKEMDRLRKDNCSLSTTVEKLSRIQKNADSQQHQQSVDLRKLKEIEADSKEKDTMITSLTESVAMLRKELSDEKLKLHELCDTYDSLKCETEELKERLNMYRSTRLFSPSQLPLGAPKTFGLNSSGNSYRPVLGGNESNTFLATPNQNKTPFFQSSPFIQTPSTSFSLRNATHLMGQTTESTDTTNKLPI